MSEGFASGNIPLRIGVGYHEGMSIADQPTDTNIDRFVAILRNNIRGDVLSDRMTCGIYSTDASHYQITPACVVIPRDEQDATFTVKTAGEFGLPITPRGGGTSLSGQTSSTGVVIDFSKYMNRVLEVNVDEQWARVQPGVIRDELNRQLAQDGLHFAPDPATGNRAAIGGMIGNNTSGTRSVVYGKTIDNLIECKVALADGTVLSFAQTGYDDWQSKERQTDREGQIYRSIRAILEQNMEEIHARFPKVMRRVSGYNLDAFLPQEQGGHPGEWNLSNLVVGSEGTLAVLLEAKIHLRPVPSATALSVIHFHDLIDAMRAVDPILEHGPSAVELLDDVVVNEALVNPTTSTMTNFIEGHPKAVLIVEVFGDSADHARQRIHSLTESLQQQGIGYAYPVRADSAGQQNVWTVRKLGLGLIANVKGERKGQAFIEDACVPTNVLPEYVEKVTAICDSHGVPVSYYAHASVGVLHTRPMLDLHNENDIQTMRAIAEEVFDVVKSYGGSWSGEHGDGIVRGEFIPKFFGERIYHAFREIKSLFDSKGLMNPGKIVDALPMDANLRFGPHYQLRPLPTTFHYRDHGGFAQTVEQCAGVGACRKTGAGTMCPSYMATRDEEHSTRGRANALRLAMSGQLGPDAMTSDRLDEVLSLCLSCKACKSECPTSVDMARLKSDVLQMRHEKLGISFGTKMLGRAPEFARRWAGPLAPLVNVIQNLPPTRWILEKVAGIDRRRPLPKLTSKPFAPANRLTTSNQPIDFHQPATVALFIDTFTNYFEPHIGHAAMKLLRSVGCHVLPTTVGCCQRPQISKGLLSEARMAGEKTLRQLDQFAQKGIPILVLEPSCASSLVDDLADLIDDAALGKRVAEQITMIDDYLAKRITEGRWATGLRSSVQKVLIHGHCHQKAMFGTASMKAIFAAVPDLDYAEIDSGCCGMAGSFGYEHFDLSKRIGEDRLFPAVRSAEPGTAIVACGISCRHQLYDMLGVPAKHWVEIIEA